ncbi:MAG TPA: 3-oxoacyl-[acyl-carrier-protein] synthase III C-terminal domain-containing protein [Pyrinomonadaceae bacterium]|jgi:3-oxoacyl-[acyl-carrier-protein] synthase-3|nr:3-oxoacyl-[acyl-carrier-protein] synthase III C-terminal domain-containing protein [Pyrinomonadaceae bacterium]
MFGAVLENDGPGVVYDSLAMTPDRFIPGGAPAIQHALGLQEIPALDIRAACANTLYALQLARALIQSNIANHVAVCLAEVQSPFLDLSPPAATLSMLFGDGAAALIVSGRDPTVRKGAIAPPLKILDVFLATNGEYVDDLGIRCPGTEFGNSRSHDPNDFPSDYLPRMNGQSVILQASRRMVSACQTVLERHELSANDVRWVVPHQANANLLAQVARGLGLSQDACEVISVLEESGNTSSASMGIALDTLRHSGKIDGGDYVLLPAFAAGFTWGAALCQA